MTPALSREERDAIRARLDVMTNGDDPSYYAGSPTAWCYTLLDALDAAEAEVGRLRGERFEAISALAWLTPAVTQDGRLSHAVRVVRDALTTAEAERDAALAEVAALYATHSRRSSRSPSAPPWLWTGQGKRGGRDEDPHHRGRVPPRSGSPRP